ncbi:MAG: hypothetical protein ABIK85_00655 [Candidatus Eisenbacteria bacterium]
MRLPAAPREALSKVFPATRLVTLLTTLVAFATLTVPAAAQADAGEHEGAADLILFRASDAVAASPAVGALDEALKALALARDDLSFRTDYADQPDSFRLALVDRLLDRPLETESYVAGFADEVRSAVSLAELVAACARDLDLTVDPRPDAGASESLEPKSAGPTALDVLLPAMGRAAGEIAAAFDGLSEEQRRFVALHAPSILDEEEFDPDKPIDERDREAEEEEALADELLRIAALVDYDRLATAGALLARAVDLAIPLVVDDPMGLPRARTESALERTESSLLAYGDVLNVMETDVGTVIIGGPGRTTYRGGAALIIDTGGDDLYEGDVAAAMRDLPIAVVIDLSGDDIYRGEPHSLGAGFMGVGILADLDGDDAYAAGNFSLGSGLFGVGVLLDERGNDSYSGDTCTEGAGAFGIGIQRDAGGNDIYHAALFSQAFGFVRGAGLLHDVAGNDVYFAGGKYTDEIRYFDHYTSLSQGFGFGWRPDASGGIGILVDEAGNDTYVTDIFGQGSSYWFAVGGLVDYRGNDHYVSYQYAQGAGTHITVAALIDCEGDDNYVSKGVSQGCGHDLAIGLLHDLSGDDNYTCHDLSQAAGNANGIGILMDDSGDDAYSVRDPGNTHGYGNLRRDYGSIGVFLDCSGSDSYSGRGADGTWWGGSVHGIGVDTETGEGGGAE